ncbi:MAG: M56 family metallopeptidase [Vicinamibacterales bacterium]
MAMRAGSHVEPTLLLSVDAAVPTASLMIAEPSTAVMATLLVLWAVSVVVALARLVAGVWMLRHVSAGATPLAGWSATGVRGAHVLVSDRIGGACAVGYVRPRILVSAALVRSLDPAMLDAIVAHEAAHLARYDDWTRLLQRLLVALTGLHPAVRWISRQIDIEREAACDLHVATTTETPLDYAKSLAAAADIARRVINDAPRHCPWRVAGWTRASRARRARARWPPRVARHACSGVDGRARDSRGGNGRCDGAPARRGHPHARGAARCDCQPAVRVDPRGMASFGTHAAPQHRCRTSTSRDRDRGCDSAAPDDRIARRGGCKSRDFSACRFLVPAPAPALEQPELPPAPLLHVLRVSTPQPSSADTAPGIGATAARVGVATADASTRAGQAIGRFFTRGGQAIANRF